MSESMTPEEEQENPIIISANEGLSGLRLKNFYMTNAFQGFVWMIFHFSMVYFFTFQLESVFLVGIFLGFANIVAFLIDIPVGILQRFYSTKRLFIFGAISQLVATFIFFGLIYSVFSTVGHISKVVVPDGFQSVISWFFGDALNWFLLVVASFCYGLTKEINDISTFGYILSHANPSEYSKILARNNITYGLGSLIGLVLSGFILSINPTIAIVILGIIITGFLVFTSQFFDNAKDSIEVSDIVSFTVAVKSLNKENIRQYLSEKINVQELPKILAANAKYIFLKPHKREKSPFDKKIFVEECKKNFHSITKILGHMPPYIIIYWTMSLVLVFGFWDTFATTFLIDFLDQIWKGWSYILLAFIAIPALGFQEFAGKAANKLGYKTVAFIGLGLSGMSLIGMGIFGGDPDKNGFIIILLAIINSLGYSCGMSLGQNGFLESYNKIYASSNNLTEIDANASAGPMKILQNLANVIGLMLGGIILGIFDYRGFFMLFGISILGLLVWSMKNKNRLEI